MGKPLCHGNRLPPQVVEEATAADDTPHDRPGTDADGDCQLEVMIAVEDADDPLDLPGKGQHPPHMVGAGDGEPADGQIGRADRPHLLDPSGLGSLVDRCHEVGEDGECPGFAGWRAEPFHADDLRDEDRHIGELPLSPFVAVAP